MINRRDIEKLLADARDLCCKLNPLKKESKKSYFVVRRAEDVILTGSEHHADLIAVIKYLHNLEKGYVLLTAKMAMKMCLWSCSVKTAENRLTAFVNDGWAERIHTPAGYVYMLNAEQYLEGLEAVYNEMFFSAPEKFTESQEEISHPPQNLPIQNKENNEVNKNNNSAVALSSDDVQDQAANPQVNQKVSDDELVSRVLKQVKIKAKNVHVLIRRYGREAVEKQLNLWKARVERYQERGDAFDPAALFTASVKYDYEPAKAATAPAKEVAKSMEEKAIEVMESLEKGAKIVLSGVQYTFEGLRKTVDTFTQKATYTGFNVGLDGQVLAVPHLTRILDAEMI